MELDALIARLIKLQEKVGAKAQVSLCVEPIIDGQTIQYEEPLKDLAIAGDRVILLGESFD